MSVSRKLLHTFVFLNRADLFPSLMLRSKESDSLDSRFYKAADAFFPAYSSVGLTYDDVTLATLYSEVLPRDTHLETHLAMGCI